MDRRQNPSQEQQNRTGQRPSEAAQNQSLPHPSPQPCPRCNSNNTKFCYYNNYSLTQPRYFCKGCRRYWTHGGTLRNVPVGGGSRKRKRPNNKLPSSSSLSSAANATLPAAAAINRSYFDPTSGLLNSNGNPSGSLLGTPITTRSYYRVGDGSSGGGFFSAVNFGPNMGLLHGLGLANLDHQQGPMTFQQLLHQNHHQQHQNLHPGIGLSTPSSSVDWILNSENNNNNDNNNNNEQNQWSNFQQVGNSGLQDP